MRKCHSNFVFRWERTKDRTSDNVNSLSAQQIASPILSAPVWKRNHRKSQSYWPLCLAMPQSHFLSTVFFHLKDQTIKNFMAFLKDLTHILRLLAPLYFRQKQFILTSTLLREAVKLTKWGNLFNISVFSLTLFLLNFCTTDSSFFFFFMWLNKLEV